MIIHTLANWLPVINALVDYPWHRAANKRLRWQKWWACDIGVAVRFCHFVAIRVKIDLSFSSTCKELAEYLVTDTRFLWPNKQRVIFKVVGLFTCFGIVWTHKLENFNHSWVLKRKTMLFVVTSHTNAASQRFSCLMLLLSKSLPGLYPLD